MSDLTTFMLERLNEEEARVLREVQADRAILIAYEKARSAQYPHPTDAGYMDGLEIALLHRVSRYSDHPDYRQEWKP